MARKKSPTLTEAELRLMEVIWDKGEVTVSDVVEVLPGRARPAYSTVLTTMRILEQKGYIRHRKEGRAFVYSAVVNRESARRHALKYVMSRFFDDSPELLLLSVLKSKEIDAHQLEQLRAMLDEEDGK